MVHIRVSTETWKKINSQREPNQTIEETLLLIINERDRLKNVMRMNAGIQT